MKHYWDTSAVINALVSTSVWSRLDSGEHVTRLHTFFEFFSTITGRGIKLTNEQGTKVSFTLSAADAATWLRKFSSRIQVDELNLDQTLAGFDQAEKKGIQGGMIYDFGHSLAAAHSGAASLLTRNTDDFRRVGGKTRLEWP